MQVLKIFVWRKKGKVQNMDVKQQYNPVRLVIGAGAVENLGIEIKKYGNRCLLIVQTNNDAMISIKNKIASILEKENILYDIFSEIRPNPLVTDIDKGIRMVRDKKYDAILAVGGGSVIDTAKILRIAEKNEICWKKMFEQSNLDLVQEKLPLIAVPTTAGTGAHCTQAAIISDETNQKHSLYSYDFFSTVALVDYTLTCSLPSTLTASTGYDAFCHLSESYIMGKLTPMIEAMNQDAMNKIAQVLPKLVHENREEYREVMAIADSCAGISLSNGGAIIPHAFGEAISSNVYRINHGCSLAICYPPFIRRCFDHSEYGRRIREVVEIINHGNTAILNGDDAAQIMIDFITSLGLKCTLQEYDVTTEERSNIKESLCRQKRFPAEMAASIIEEICG